MSILCNLPPEILEAILKHLSVTEFTRLSSVCKELHNLVESENLWKQRCFNEFNISSTQTFRQVGWKPLYKALLNPSVYTWGESSHGRLGHEVELFSARPRVVTALDGKGVTQIVCGGWSMTALTKQGEVWTWGTMNAEASPYRNPDDYDEEAINDPTAFYTVRRGSPVVCHRTPVQIEALRGKKVRSIASGRAHSLALTNNGEVYQWRTLTKVKKIGLSEDDKIVQIAAGWSHSLALSRDGRIYSWNSDTPNLISEGKIAANTSEHEQYVMVVGGENFTVALTNLGRIYKSEGADLSCLSLFSGASGRKFTHISSAFRKFAAFNENGDVAIWDASGKQEDHPELQNRGVNQVVFGDWHFGALTDDGALYTWGQASGGALGHGDLHQAVEHPTLVQGLEHRYIFSVAFAGWHSAALVVPLQQSDSTEIVATNSLWKPLKNLLSSWLLNN